MAQWNSLCGKRDLQLILHRGRARGAIHQLRKWGVGHQSMIGFLAQRVAGIVLVLRNLIGPVYGCVMWICNTIAEGT